MRIEAVISTHVHADHRSGDRELATQTGAALYLHRSADVGYNFTALQDGADVSLGNVIIRALHTPGHTPESISLIVTDLSRAATPWMALTGDTLFVGDVGRPDFGGRDAGSVLFDSLHERLLTLPDYIEVYPAHISGSPCGKAMSGKPSSTIGFERQFNSALQIQSRDDFVTALFKDLGPKPDAFLATIAANRG